MFPYKQTLQLSKTSNRALYLQLSDQISKLIKSSILLPNTKLPGSRTMATLLEIHRKTVISAYDELMAQGWIITIPAKGTFVNTELPIIHTKAPSSIRTPIQEVSFKYHQYPELDRNPTLKHTYNVIKIDEGIPDVRLAAIEDIAKNYRDLTKKKHFRSLLAYNTMYGNLNLRKALVSYLNETRGLRITEDHILITRGSQMGIYLASQILLKQQEVIVVGETNYMTADTTFTLAGGCIERVPVDAYGIDTEAISKLCTQKKISAVYVTSHHHHPTTVMLSAERRMHLLQLAHQYQFAIIEDDYDYDFHYDNAPILPLASHDEYGNVMYIGSFTKLIAPAIRVGYMIGPKPVIHEAAKLRRVIDRQGDTYLEQTLAHMIHSGDIQRHIHKTVKTYKTRRDLFCQLLFEKLGDYFNFEIPKGGMAIWVCLDKKYDWDEVTEKAAKLDLGLPEWQRYDNDNSRHNGIRMGFASLTEDEIIMAIERLHKVMTSIS